MPENSACQEFELQLQDAMDLRCSPREMCGNHEHLDSCEACQRLLQDFCVLSQSLESFSLATDDRQLVAAVVSPDGNGDGETWQDSASGWGRFSRAGRRFPDPVAVAVCAILVCAFFVSPRFWTADSFSSQLAGNRAENSLGSSLVAVAPGKLIPDGVMQSSTPSTATEPRIPVRQMVVSAQADRPVQSFASCIRIADQIPGVPPIRWSVTNTVNWFWSSIPDIPRIPTLRQIMPGFGQTGPSSSLQWV